jgi:PadR family transcriptional regulator, regulatory protein PadR
VVVLSTTTKTSVIMLNMTAIRRGESVATGAIHSRVTTLGHGRVASMPKQTAQTQAVLIALLRDPTESLYGLEIAKAAGLASGTIYPILARLERHGWVESEWEEIDESAEGRRRRRYYRLTSEGARIAREEMATTVRQLRAAGLQIGPFHVGRVA